MTDMTKKLPIFIEDAFTEHPFGGNPAAVCLLKEDIDDDLKQKIAAEMNLSETAFVLPFEPVTTDVDPFASESKFHLRWFTPVAEIALCGHATLATAAVLFYEMKNSNQEVEFVTRKRGSLFAEKSSSHANGVRMVLPRSPANAPIQEKESWDIVEACLGSENKPHIVEAAISPSCGYLMVVMGQNFTQLQLRELTPDFKKMTTIPKSEKEEFIALLVTCQDDPEGEFDFASRIFAPWVGIEEDPTCGSAHTVSGLHWSSFLSKTSMKAQQSSKRGGQIWLQVLPDAVEISGCTAIVLEGHIKI